MAVDTNSVDGENGLSNQCVFDWYHNFQWFFYSVITFSFTKCFVHSYTVDVVFTLSYDVIMNIFYTSVIKSLWPSGVIWRQRSGSTLAQVMPCCLTAPSHSLNITKICLKITCLKFHSNFPGANELDYEVTIPSLDVVPTRMGMLLKICRLELQI